MTVADGASGDDGRRELPAAGLADRSRTAREPPAAARASTRAVARLGGAPRAGAGRRDAARRVRHGARRSRRRDGRRDAAGRATPNRFATALDGVDLDEPGVALDRTGHPNPVPRVTGPIRRTRPVEVRDVEFLRSITDRRIKITVPGPFTMTQQAQNDYYDDERSLALAYAAAVNEELHDLKAAGADIVQIDEPYLQARPEPAREYAVEAIDRALEGIEGPTVLHTCFGYAAHRSRPPPRLPVPSRARRVPRDTSVARGGTAEPRGGRAPRGSEQDRRSRSPRPRLGGGRDARGGRAAHSDGARGPAARASRSRARLRDEVPPSRAGLRQARGDGRGCTARPATSSASDARLAGPGRPARQRHALW